jgi:hypothetical protein
MIDVDVLCVYGGARYLAMTVICDLELYICRLEAKSRHELS